MEAREIGDLDLAPPVPLGECDRNTIEAALAAPRAGFEGHEEYPSLPSKAAVLLYTLAKSQACPDGNKRVALILVEVFLRINEATLDEGAELVAKWVERAAVSDRGARDEVVRDLTSWLTTSIASLNEEGSA